MTDARDAEREAREIVALWRGYVGQPHESYNALTASITAALQRRDDKLGRLNDRVEQAEAQVRALREAAQEAVREILYWRSIGWCFEEGWSRVLARLEGVAPATPPTVKGDTHAV